MAPRAGWLIPVTTGMKFSNITYISNQTCLAFYKASVQRSMHSHISGVNKTWETFQERAQQHDKITYF